MTNKKFPLSFEVGLPNVEVKIYRKLGNFTIYFGPLKTGHLFSHFSKYDITNNYRLVIFLHVLRNIHNSYALDLCCTPGKISKL